MRRIARIQVNPELLHKALRLPEGARVVASADDPATFSFWILLESDDFPKVPEACVPPNLCPTIHSDRKDCGHEELTWEWNLE